MNARAWPLVFSYRGIVIANGFEAIADARCRVLAEEQPEDGNFWLNGALPGGIAAGGTDISSADKEFATMFRAILRDTAEENSTFTGFRKTMNDFFAEVDRTVNKAWLEASVANIEGTLDCQPLDWMIRATGDETRPRLQVVQVREPGVMNAGHPTDESATSRASTDGGRRTEHHFSRIAA